MVMFVEQGEEQVDVSLDAGLHAVPLAAWYGGVCGFDVVVLFDVDGNAAPREIYVWFHGIRILCLRVGLLDLTGCLSRYICSSWWGHWVMACRFKLWYR